MTLADQIEALLERATPRHNGEMRTTREQLAYDNLAKLAYDNASTILTALRSDEALRAENARLREAIARIANTVNVADGPYHTLLKAADEWLSWTKKTARAALKDTGHE